MGASMGSMPGGAACRGFDPAMMMMMVMMMMMMMMMGAQYFMSMMQQGVNPFGKGNPASPEDLVYLTQRAKAWLLLECRPSLHQMSRRTPKRASLMK